jgi:hypothetical protein
LRHCVLTITVVRLGKHRRFARESTQTSITMNAPGEHTLEGLATELHLLIANYLQKSHLAVLSRVPKILHIVADDVLYKSIDILSSENATPPEADDEPEEQAERLHLANFFGIMLARPDLHKRVQSARIVVSLIAVPMDISGLCSPAVPPSPLVLSLNATVSEATLAGSLLSLLTEVTTLSLDTYNIVDKHSLNALCELFQGRTKHVRQDPSLVPAFRKLKDLSWSSLYFPFLMACLPELKHLRISSECANEEPDTNNLEPKLAKLTLYRNTTIFFSSYGRLGSKTDTGVFPFIGRCTSLRDFILALNRERFPDTENLGQGVDGNLDRLVRSVHVNRPELESFTLRAGRKLHNSFLDHVTSIAPYIFHPFTDLKYLRIPQIQLLGANKDAVPLKQQLIESLLPPTLEHLAIDYPVKTILDFLDWVAQERMTVPCLAKITLYCADHRCNRGIACTDENGTPGLLSQWNAEQVVTDLRGLGIVVVFLEMEDAWR